MGFRFHSIRDYGLKNGLSNGRQLRPDSLRSLLIPRSIKINKHETESLKISLRRNGIRVKIKRLTFRIIHPLPKLTFCRSQIQVNSLSFGAFIPHKSVHIIQPLCLTALEIARHQCMFKCCWEPNSDGGEC